MSQPSHHTSTHNRRGRALVAAFGLLALITSGVLWSVASPTLGPIYDGLRTIETAGLWRLTNWSQSFRAGPSGRPHDFLSIYVSSIPFGLFIAVLIATIAALAFEKRRTRHLYALITPKPGTLTEAALRGRMKSVLPHLGAPEGAPAPDWSDDTPENPFASLGDLRNPVQVRAAAARLSLPLARVLYLTLTAREDGSQTIAGLRPGAVEADAWRALRPCNAKPLKSDATAQATLTSALVQLIATRPGLIQASDPQAVAMQDELLRTPGSTADMLTALIDYMRRTGSFPPSCLRWTRWALPQLALGFQGAGAPALTTMPENDDART